MFFGHAKVHDIAKKTVDVLGKNGLPVTSLRLDIGEDKSAIR